MICILKIFKFTDFLQRLRTNKDDDNEGNENGTVEDFVNGDESVAVKDEEFTDNKVADSSQEEWKEAEAMPSQPIDTPTSDETTRHNSTRQSDDEDDDVSEDSSSSSSSASSSSAESCDESEDSKEFTKDSNDIPVDVDLDDFENIIKQKLKSLESLDNGKLKL